MIIRNLIPILCLFLFASFGKLKTITTGQYIELTQVGSHDASIWPTYMYLDNGEFSIRSNSKHAFPLHRKFAFSTDKFDSLVNYTRYYYTEHFEAKNEPCVYFNCFHIELVDGKKRELGFDIHACSEHRKYFEDLNFMVPAKDETMDLKKMLNRIIGCSVAPATPAGE
ncbi:MAG: hypothetical protein K8F30_08940 [Taibaiella sp.]|nr:hypothetical protein [Taibaiella sp.]